MSSSWWKCLNAVLKNPLPSSSEPPVPARAAIFVPWMQLLGMLPGQLCWCTATQGGLSPLWALGCASGCCAGRTGGWGHCQPHSVPVLSDCCKCKFLKVLLQKGCFEHLCWMYLLTYMLTFMNECKQKYTKSLFRVWDIYSPSWLLMTLLKHSCTDTEEGLTVVQLKQVPAAVAACLHNIRPEFRSLFLAAVETAVCGAGSVLSLCSANFPGRGFRLVAQKAQTHFSRIH